MYFLFKTKFELDALRDSTKLLSYQFRNNCNL